MDAARADQRREAGLRTRTRLMDAALDLLAERGEDGLTLRELTDAAEANGLLTAAAFRDRLDNGRKVAIQILEFFDKAGLTIRAGDVRRVRKDRLGMFGHARAEADRAANSG